MFNILGRLWLIFWNCVMSSSSLYYQSALPQTVSYTIISENATERNPYSDSWDCNALNILFIAQLVCLLVFPSLNTGIAAILGLLAIFLVYLWPPWKTSPPHRWQIMVVMIKKPAASAAGGGAKSQYHIDGIGSTLVLHTGPFPIYVCTDEASVQTHCEDTFDPINCRTG
ncbi:hypothetical protein B0H15DRAFT_847641 [Mycena belliarum]|uniref:Uncharacterized protein n=1 Tax=Mycena belliarum TaxID=1033014 RepID=A0AAD6U169_9AGAR|nr:hypothetical protein B0H15DRAFT_847641 [Mycena belliae]